MLQAEEEDDIDNIDAMFFPAAAAGGASSSNSAAMDGAVFNPNMSLENNYGVVYMVAQDRISPVPSIGVAIQLPVKSHGIEVFRDPNSRCKLIVQFRWPQATWTSLNKFFPNNSVLTTTNGLKECFSVQFTL